MLTIALQYILDQRGKSADFAHDVVVQDNGDGAGLQLMYWNTEKLGPQPTLAELQAAEADAMVQHAARRKIAEIEAQITPRRLREAVLTQAGRDWLAEQDNKIKAERALGLTL